MASINQSEITDIKYGNLPIKAVYLGDQLIWPVQDYLRVSPTMVFLSRYNDNTADVLIYSNVDWITE